LLKIRFVVRAGREQHGARFIRRARREFDQRALRVAKKSGEAMNVIVAKRFRQDARRDETIRERVTRAGRDLRAVGNHPPASVWRTREVGGVENAGT